MSKKSIVAIDGFGCGRPGSSGLTVVIPPCSEERTRSTATDSGLAPIKISLVRTSTQSLRRPEPVELGQTQSIDVIEPFAILAPNRRLEPPPEPFVLAWKFLRNGLLPIHLLPNASPKSRPLGLSIA
ncbi:hypothetical protein GW17_00053613 [Ensete ventricosum]|nr:hypothetical protein GW17_00053613 [Ensete ventricosum]